MPISLHVQIMRQAISPRFAIRILRNLRALELMIDPKVQSLASNACRPKPDAGHWTLEFRLLFLYSEEWLAVLNRLPILNVDLYDLATGLGLNLIHQLHRLDDADD